MRYGAPILVLLPLFLCISACSSLERSADLVQHRLIAGQSTKSDVVNSIGLPRSSEKTKDGNIEFWYYTGKPISTSYFVPIPVSRASYTPGLDIVNYVDLGSKRVIGNDPVVLVCAFNQVGQLIRFHTPEKNND